MPRVVGDKSTGGGTKNMKKMPTVMSYKLTNGGTTNSKICQQWQVKRDAKTNGKIFFCNVSILHVLKDNSVNELKTKYSSTTVNCLLHIFTTTAKSGYILACVSSIIFCMNYFFDVCLVQCHGKHLACNYTKE